MITHINTFGIILNCFYEQKFLLHFDFIYCDVHIVTKPLFNIFVCYFMKLIFDNWPSVIALA